MTQLNSSLSEWGAVAAHANELAGAHLRDLTAARPAALAELPRRARFLAARYFTPAHHAARPCRCCSIWRARRICQGASRRCFAAIRSTAPSNARYCIRRCAPTSPGRRRCRRKCTSSRKKLVDFVAAVRSGKKLGITGKQFKHVVNIGIGGSDLGPLLVCDALKAEWSGGITPHFVSNVDRTQLEDLKRSIDPAETLVIVCSKTFTSLRRRRRMPMRRGLGSSARSARSLRRITSPPYRPTRKRWMPSASPPTIASPCGIGWAAAIRCGRRSA